MSKGMPSNLEAAIRDVLGQAVSIEGASYSSSFKKSNLDSQKQQAVDYLVDLGVLRLSGAEYSDARMAYVTLDMIRVTASGRDYWEQLNAPRWYWFRHNWFAASVAFGTILFGAAAAGANIANLII